jgi:hypothetical protein
MYQYLLALSLIVGSDEIPKGTDGENLFIYLKTSFAEIGVEREILDAKEAKFTLMNLSCFINDISTLRRRYIEFKDAPSVYDSLRFPDREYINELIAFNRLFRNRMELLSECYLHKSDEYKEIVRESDKIYSILDTVRDAKCEYYYITIRREALVRLKELLGNQGYYSGELPVPVPFWRFREIK